MGLPSLNSRPRSSATHRLQRTAEQPASLERIVRELGARPESWIERVRLSVDRRWYERLCYGPDYDVWAISWMPGQSTGFHDHGGSSGAFYVVSGELEEHRPNQTPAVLAAGGTRVFGPQYLHDVRNASVAPAISVHVYSPPLRDMTHYVVDGDDVRAVEDGHRTDNTDGDARIDRRSTDDWRVSRIDNMLAAARRRLQRLTPVEAHEALTAGAAVLVDIRPERQRAREGTVPGALVVERNVLEWRLDPTSPDRLLRATGRDLQVIVLCSEGYASTFAAESLQALGLWRASDVIGGFHAWRAEGLPCRTRQERKT